MQVSKYHLYVLEWSEIKAHQSDVITHVYCYLLVIAVFRREYFAILSWLSSWPLAVTRTTSLSSIMTRASYKGVLKQLGCQDDTVSKQSSALCRTIDRPTRPSDFSHTSMTDTRAQVIVRAGCHDNKPANVTRSAGPANFFLKIACLRTREPWLTSQCASNR